MTPPGLNDDIHTPRLLLTGLRPEDAADLSVLRSDPRVNRYLDRKPHNEQEAAAFIGRVSKAITEGESLYRAIRLIDSGRLAGTVCVWNFSQDRSSAELGYELHPDFQGMGFALEAVNAMIAHLRRHTGLKSLDAYTHPGNERSSGLLLKAGFSLQPHRSSVTHPGDLVYALELR